MVKANANTGLAAQDVFYFGNAIGDTGNSAANTIVNSTDQLAARNNTTLSAAISNLFDFNRDGTVNATDEIIARNNGTTALNATKLIGVPLQVATTPISAPTRRPTRAPARTPIRSTPGVENLAAAEASRDLETAEAPVLVPSSLFSQVPIESAISTIAAELLGPSAGALSLVEDLTG